MIKITYYPTGKIFAGACLDANIAYYKPDPAILYFLELKNNSAFAKCPAFIEYFKNAFIIRAPYDLEIKVENDQVTTDKYGQDFFNENITINHIADSERKLVLQLLPKYIFITDTDQSIPMSVSELPFTPYSPDYRFIPGKFDMSKWVRPVHYAIEVNQDTVIKFTRGDPLFMLTFHCDEKVELELGVVTEDVMKLVGACTSVKNRIPKQSLKRLYEMAEDYVTLMKKRIYNKV